MARPKGTPKQRLVLWLDADLAEWIAERAAAKDRTAAEHVAGGLRLTFEAAQPSAAT